MPEIDLEFREPTESELEQIERLDNLLFGFTELEGRYYTRRKQADFLYCGVMPDGTVAVSLRVYPFHAWVGGTRYKVGGLGNIACQPHLRRRGYTSALVAHALHECRERGYQLAYVWPFDHGFYRALGFEVVERTTTYSFFPEQLPEDPSQRFIFPVLEDRFEELNDFYNQFVAPSHNGLVERTIEDWLNLVRSGRHIYGFIRGNICGYLIAQFEMVDPLCQRILIEELYGTDEAVRGLWSFVRSLSDQFREARYITDIREPFHLLIKDPRKLAASQKLGGSVVQQALNFGFMARIVNLKSCFSTPRNFNHAHGEVLIEVSDPTLPTNHSVWLLQFAEGQPSVQEIILADRRDFPNTKLIRTDISTLSALFMCAYRPSVLFHYGLIEADSEKALELLDQAFDGKLPRLHTQF